MTMDDMQDSDSKSLEALVANQRKREIAADDYFSKIENWLKLADQLLATDEKK
jgi:hypothetical protein